MTPILIVKEDEKCIAVMFDVNAFDHPNGWVVVLAEIVEHLADGLSHTEGYSPAHMRKYLVDTLVHELTHPTKKDREGGMLPDFPDDA